ncbi:MAG: hypothetical protein HKN13_11605 [Rhodothermales bacterium]|nr:hypothetical protein [Rhodothermales bacterium]
MNRFIQQESTYWRRSLWDRAGGALDENLKTSLDFELWIRFFRYAQLYNLNGLVGAFRLHDDQRSFAGRDVYDAEVADVLRRERELLGIPEDPALQREIRDPRPVVKQPIKYDRESKRFQRLEMAPASALSPEQLAIRRNQSQLVKAREIIERKDRAIEQLQARLRALSTQTPSVESDHEAAVGAMREHLVRLAEQADRIRADLGKAIVSFGQPADRLPTDARGPAASSSDIAPAKPRRWALRKRKH